MTSIARRVLVAGRVQGVWFRESTRKRATELALRGWVRNLPDGRVEAYFEGRPDAVEAVVEFVRNGPPLARVISVEVFDETSHADRTATEHDGAGFRVR